MVVVVLWAIIQIVCIRAAPVFRGMGAVIPGPVIYKSLREE